MTSFPLKAGCYHVKCTALKRTEKDVNLLPFLEGTIRFSIFSEISVMSGDLYETTETAISQDLPELDRQVNPIPHFKLKNYRYFLQFSDFTEERSNTINFVSFKFYIHEKTEDITWPGSPDIDWERKGHPYFLDIKNIAIGDTVFQGDVKCGGSVVGHMTLTWISEYYRSATLEIDKSKQAEPPNMELTSVGPPPWDKVFKTAGWHINLVVDDINLKLPISYNKTKVWKDNELHTLMKYGRMKNRNPEGWHYYLACLNGVYEKPRILGIMFDKAYRYDTLPREGAVVFPDVTFLKTDSWESGKPAFPTENESEYTLSLGQIQEAYVRTVVHEIGHAMGLGHEQKISSVMMPISRLFEEDSSPAFPANIKWEFSYPQRLLLTHMPDYWVRPGGIRWQPASYAQLDRLPTPFKIGSSELPLCTKEAVHQDMTSFLALARSCLNSKPKKFWQNIFPRESAGINNLAHERLNDHQSLKLTGSFYAESQFPLGAPVRFSVHLACDNKSTNKSIKKIKVPESFNLKHGHVHITVRDSKNMVVDVVRPLMTYLETKEELILLAPGEQICYDYTILHGYKGALFPKAGTYTINCSIVWYDEETWQKISGDLPPIEIKSLNNTDPDHRLAEEIINAPEVTEFIAFGGDHLEKGHTLVKRALKNDILRPHYVYLEARRLAQHFFDNVTTEYVEGLSIIPRLADQQEATVWISNNKKDIVLTANELQKVAEWFSILSPEVQESEKDLAAKIKALSDTMYKNNQLSKMDLEKLQKKLITGDLVA